MNEKIEPVLTAEERANPNEIGYFDWPNGIVDTSGHHTDESIRRLPAQIIALANAALPDSDPRKLTREKVRALRALADRLAGVNDMSQEIGDGYPPDVWQSVELEEGVALLRAHADALESYLPPEK